MEPELDTEVHDENNGTHTKSKEPGLAKYVKRHHALDQIIRDKFDGTMTRRKLKGTCLLTKFEPRNIKDALVMNEEIE